MAKMLTAVEWVALAQSTDKHRPILEGALYDADRKVLVSTDTHRLHIAPILPVELSEFHAPGTVAVVGESQVKKELKALEKTAQKTSSSLDELTPEQIFKATCERAGTYPNWARVVPDQYTYRVRVEAPQTLLHFAEMFKNCCRDNANRVRIKIENGWNNLGILNFSARSDMNGNFTGTPTCQVEVFRAEFDKDKKQIVGETKVEDMDTIPENIREFALNIGFLVDALKVTQGVSRMSMDIRLTCNSRAILFDFNDARKGYQAVIMPMALY